MNELITINYEKEHRNVLRTIDNTLLKNEQAPLKHWWMANSGNWFYLANATARPGKLRNFKCEEVCRNAT